MSALWAGGGYRGQISGVAAAEAAEITTVDELFTYAATDGSYTISSSGGDGSGIYDLSTRTGGGSDLTITGNWTLSIAGSGNVTIDGANLYKVIFDDDGAAMTSTISGTDNSKRIIFTRGDDSTIAVQSSAAAVTVTFTYCNFTDANTYDNLAINSNPAVGEITVTCNFCNSAGAKNDGFSMASLAAWVDDKVYLTGAVVVYGVKIWVSRVNNNIGNPPSEGEYWTERKSTMTLNLNECKSYSNGDACNDQGATAHCPLQYLNVTGGEYYNNNGQGIAVVGGSQLWVKNANFYDNGEADIHNEDNAVAVIDSCDFHSYANRSAIRAHGQLIRVSNCRFYDSRSGTCVAILADSGFISVSNCTFDGFNTDLSRGISLIGKSVGADISYNTFYDMVTCIGIGTNYGATVKGNIFHTTSNYCIMTSAQQYKNNNANGYNYFYNCAHDFYDPVLIYGSQLQSTDVADVDPLLIDPANGDFHLQSSAGRWNPDTSSWTSDENTSPGIDAGDPNSDWTAELWPHGKRINVGAYGGTPQASMSLSPVGHQADITTVDELFTNAAIEGSYTISSSGGDGGGVYDLSTRTGGGSDLTITGNWTLTIAGSGNVTIDGANLYKVIFDGDGGAMTSAISGTNDSNRIIFTQGGSDTVWVRSSAAAVTVTFNYCDFSEDNSQHGLLLFRAPAADVNVTCNYCRAYNNAQGGFNMGDGEGNAHWQTLTLNNCKAYDNVGNCGGVTGHNAYQRLYINGGEIYGNTAGGIVAVAGTCVHAKNVIFHDNAAQDVLIGEPTDGTCGIIENCEFYNLNAATGATYHIVSNGEALTVINNYFHDDGGTSGHAIYTNGGITTIKGNIFDSVSRGTNRYCVYIDSGSYGVYAENNVFYNATSVMHLPAIQHTFRNNIIHTTSDFAVMTYIKEYEKNQANGYNYFYNCNQLFYDDGIADYCDQCQATDVKNIDPQLMDPANGDFHLQSSAGRWNPATSSWTSDENTSPGIDAGAPNSAWTAELWPHGKRINVGAYGGTPQASMSLSPAGNRADFNHDGMVDNEDLALFAARWLVEGVLLPQDIDRNNLVNTGDLAELVEEWLRQD